MEAIDNAEEMANKASLIAESAANGFKDVANKLRVSTHAWMLVHGHAVHGASAVATALQRMHGQRWRPLHMCIYTCQNSCNFEVVRQKMSRITSTQEDQWQVPRRFAPY